MGFAMVVVAACGLLAVADGFRFARFPEMFSFPYIPPIPPIQIPEIKMPQINFPQIELPQIEVPQIDLSKIEIPSAQVIADAQPGFGGTYSGMHVSTKNTDSGIMTSVFSNNNGKTSVQTFYIPSSSTKDSTST